MQVELSEKLKVCFLILVGIIPLLWFRPGYIIAKGDYFPFWLDRDEVSSSDIFLYSDDYLGTENIFGSYLLYGIMWLILRFFKLSTGLIQILIQVFFFGGAGLSMHYLSKTVYPKLKLCPMISSIFYMFNLFVLQSRLNIGFALTYTFLPLLMALLIRIVEVPDHQNQTTTNKYIIYFSTTLMVTLSIASLNPANIVLILLILVVVLFYYLIIQRKQFRPLLLNLTRITFLSIILNLWWTIPFLNYYFWMPLTPTSRISVTTWAWTHRRASFLNLFWLNGVWNWRSEYVPYIDSYANPLLTILTFVPFFLAAGALLFKTDKSPLNNYFMLTTLTFLFLAKGLHEPLNELNLALYTYVPGMNMFREPASKFTMALLPFLALLIGYAVHHIASAKIGKHETTNLTKTTVTTFFILIFIISTYPLITNPVETRTSQLPFSSYVKIPDYWYEATDWLNEQPGDYKILITPPNDFYQMPYAWGYYGTDFLTRIIQKPVLLNNYAYSYKTNPDVTATQQQLYNSIKYNRTDEFKALLDLLNIKYILQRNDVLYNFTGHNIIPPKHIQAFIIQQPYIHLAQKFGQLDIYEYNEPKPYLYIISHATLKHITIKIENITLIRHSWSFTSLTDAQEWQNATQPNQWQTIYTIIQDNNTLKTELWNSTWGWKTINSPFLPAQYGTNFQIQTDIKGQNAHQVHIKIAEFDTNKNIFATTYMAFVNDGDFDWMHTTFNFEPTNKATEYLQIQVWHGHETNKPFPNIIWIDNIRINGYTTRLNTTGLNLVFQNTTLPATILGYTKVDPTKMTATINATQPFILAISEAINQSWAISINGKRIECNPLYLGLTRFYINQTGILEITIEYEPQKWFYYGSIISITMFLVCIAYLIYNYGKHKTM